MLNTQYEETVSTLVNYTFLKSNNLVILAAATTANRTITLPLARESDEVFVYNASAFNATIAVQSGDSLVGSTSVPPGAMVRFTAAGQTTWYTFSGGGVAGAQQSKVTNLSAVNINAIRSTPIVLVPAGASGSCVIVDNISFKMTASATAFAAGGALEFRYTGTSGTKVSADVAAAVVTAGAGVSFTNVRGIEASLTGTVDAPVVVTCATQDFTTGTGVAVVTTHYHYV